MVKIKFFRTENRINGFKVLGHAMPRNRQEEYDLICGSVSVLVLAITNGLTEVLKLKPETLEVNESEGLIKCILPRGLDDQKESQVQALLETLELGLRAIAQNYPRYVRFVND